MEIYWLPAVLLISIILIILGTNKLKLHPFLVLLFVSYITGILAGLDPLRIAEVITSGFGSIMGYIGIIIVLGTIIGVVLEKSFAAVRIAELVVKVVGKRYPGLAMSIIGYIVSIPVFCDSAFIILSSVRKSISAKTGKSAITLSIALATGLYATHTFVPPTPGPIAAAGNLGMEAELGLLILVGLCVAAVAMITGYFYAEYIGRKISLTVLDPTLQPIDVQLPGAIKSLLPIIVPILLISLRSIVDYPTRPWGENSITQLIQFIGQPVNALLSGFLLSLLLFPAFNKETLTGWIGDGISAAAPILLITGAGGAFGTVLKETGIGNILGDLFADYNLGIFLPFLVAALFKTAQGSSTVALIATSALLAPLLGSMGMDSAMAKVLVVLSTGAGAMTVSHANDSFFWVVSQFTGMDVRSSYYTQTIATLIQGVSSMIVVWLISLVLL